MLTAKEKSLLSALEPRAASEGVEIVTLEIVGSKKALTIRVYIDAAGGISFDELARTQAWVGDVMDELDPFPGAYMLEVSSPGIERQLTRDWHFEALMGEQLLVRLIRPVEGVRDFIGTLSAYTDGVLTLLLDEETEMNVERGETAFIRLYNDFSGGISK